MAADGRRASSQDLSAGSEDGVCSKAWFDTLSVQPLTLPFGIAPEEGMLPEVRVCLCFECVCACVYSC